MPLPIVFMPSVSKIKSRNAGKVPGRSKILRDRDERKVPGLNLMKPPVSPCEGEHDDASVARPCCGVVLGTKETEPCQWSWDMRLHCWLA